MQKIKEIIKRQEELKEKLADIEHQRWSDWQKYLHSKCITGENGELIIPPSSVENWERQIKTPYKDLSEKEKDSDREQVDRYWELIRQSQKELIEEVIKEMLGEDNSLATAKTCTFYSDHKPVWDGNNFTCENCGGQFKSFKEAKAKAKEILKELK